MPDRSGPIQRIYGEFPPGQPKRGRCRTVRWPAHRKPAWTAPFRGDLAMSALGCFDYAVSPNGSFSVVGVPAGIGRPNAASSAASAVPSDRCGVEDLLLPFDPGSEARVGLDLRPGWVKRWSASWRVAGEEVVNPVGDLGSAPLVVSQPFRLRFGTCDGWRDHTPDFVGVLGDGDTWVLDVRPRGRVDKQARVCFAATAEVALAAGWRYAVVTGWHGQVLATLDALSAQRRPLTDRLGLQAELVEAAAVGPCAFGALVAATSLPVVARAHALHLLWHRKLGVDLAAPLHDTSLVWPGLAGWR